MKGCATKVNFYIVCMLPFKKKNVFYNYLKKQKKNKSTLFGKHVGFTCGPHCHIKNLVLNLMCHKDSIPVFHNIQYSYCS